MLKLKQKVFKLSAVIAVSMLFVVSVPQTAGAQRVQNDQDAIETCERLPDGQTFEGIRRCYYTNPATAGTCHVSMQGEVPVPGGHCSALTYDQMIGQNSEDIIRLIESGTPQRDTDQGTNGSPSFDEDCSTGEPNSSNCDIIKYLVIFINTLSALAGIVILGSIIYGGIQYSMASSDSQKVSAAKDRIRNALIALMLFIFGYGLLNYLIPGGLL